MRLDGPSWPLTMIGGAEGEEDLAPLPAAQRCTLIIGKRAALVARMLPAYRVLLRSGDHIPVQDKGDTVHTQVS